MENIIFIGMPTSGKSTIGVVVAKRLGFQFIDTDLLIQEQEGKLLCELIAEKGTDGFLAIENQVNRDVDATNAVIAPGGSVIYCREAMEHFKEIGTVVYLKMSYETLMSRIRDPQKRGVVLAEGQTMHMLYDERVQLFEQYAEVIFDEDQFEWEEMPDRVLEALEDL
ncbi:MAG: shikimate kinase [Hespellia sp.]|nr:shikimate kinase [Hespellia sp.]